MTALDDIRAKRFEGSEPIGVVMDHTGAGPDGHGGTLERRGVAKLGYAWEAAQVLFRRRVWESGGKQCVGLGCSSTLRRRPRTDKATASSTTEQFAHCYKKYTKRRQSTKRRW